MKLKEEIKATVPARSTDITDLRSTMRRELLVEVTPEDARRLLGAMHEGQRKSSLAKVRSFERLIRDGKFIQPSEPGVYVDTQGRVCNGRHRLAAQLNVEATLTWKLVLGASRDEILVLDQVRSRAVHQSVNLATDAERMSHREEAVIRQYLRLEDSPVKLKTEQQTLTVDDVLAARTLYADDIRWALGAFPNVCGPASLVAAAAYARPACRESIEAFSTTFRDARLMRPGTYRDGDPAFTLAKFIMNSGKGRAGASYTDEVLLKTLTAVMLYAQGKATKKMWEHADVLAWFAKQRSRLAL